MHNNQANKKKRKSRREYLNDFRLDAKGEYVYVGKMYKFVDKGTNLKKELLKLWVLSIVMLAAGIINGCIPAAGMMGCIYVIIPYTASLLASVSVVWALCRLTTEGDTIRAYIYDATIAKLPIRATLTIAFSAITLIGETVFIVLNGFENNAAATILFIAFESVVIVNAYLTKCCVLRQEWHQTM